MIIINVCKYMVAYRSVVFVNITELDLNVCRVKLSSSSGMQHKGCNCGECRKSQHQNENCVWPMPFISLFGTNDFFNKELSKLSNDTHTENCTS